MNHKKKKQRRGHDWRECCALPNRATPRLASTTRKIGGSCRYATVGRAPRQSDHGTPGRSVITNVPCCSPGSPSPLRPARAQLDPGRETDRFTFTPFIPEILGLPFESVLPAGQWGCGRAASWASRLKGTVRMLGEEERLTSVVRPGGGAAPAAQPQGGLQFMDTSNFSQSAGHGGGHNTYYTQGPGGAGGYGANSGPMDGPMVISRPVRGRNDSNLTAAFPADASRVATPRCTALSLCRRGHSHLVLLDCVMTTKRACGTFMLPWLLHLAAE
jgi:hypothetical protein